MILDFEISEMFETSKILKNWKLLWKSEDFEMIVSLKFWIFLIVLVLNVEKLEKF
jgi:hypothetical protein